MFFREKKINPNIEKGDIIIDRHFHGSTLLLAENNIMLFEEKKRINKHLDIIAKKGTDLYEKLLSILDFDMTGVEDPELRKQYRAIKTQRTMDEKKPIPKTTEELILHFLKKIEKNTRKEGD